MSLLRSRWHAGTSRIVASLIVTAFVAVSCRTVAMSEGMTAELGPEASGSLALSVSPAPSSDPRTAAPASLEPSPPSVIAAITTPEVTIEPVATSPAGPTIAPTTSMPAPSAATARFGTSSAAGLAAASVAEDGPAATSVAEVGSPAGTVTEDGPAGSIAEVGMPAESALAVETHPAAASSLPAGARSATAATSPTPSEPAPRASPRSRTVDGGLHLSKAKRAKLERILANQVRNKGIVGLQAAVRLPSGESWSGTAGKAELSPDRSIAADTQFAIASVTKTFVAALILQLAEEGKIDLDAPFGTYFTDAPRHKTVTVRQLLSHTSGIYNYFANPRYGKAAEAWLRRAPTGLNSREHRWTYDEIMGLVKSGYCKPGACYVYSNTNYVILGKVAEAVGRAPIAAQMRERFFEPLGLERTVYQPGQRPDPDAAHGHWPSPGGHEDHTRDSRLRPFVAAVTVADAAGAIASTASDLATWAAALYGGEVLSRASLREMTRILPEGTYGLGTDLAYYAGHRAYGHRGGLRGFESSMWYFPDSGVSIALLSNQGNWVTDVPMLKLVRTVLGKA